MEPAVIFVVAGIVGTIVISLYLPMFSLITNMGVSFHQQIEARLALQKHQLNQIPLILMV